MAKVSANEACNLKSQAIVAKLNKIRAEVETRKMEEVRDWADFGSLGFVDEKLKEIMDFLNISE